MTDEDLREVLIFLRFIKTKNAYRLLDLVEEEKEKGELYGKDCYVGAGDQPYTEC